MPATVWRQVLQNELRSLPRQLVEGSADGRKQSPPGWKACNDGFAGAIGRQSGERWALSVVLDSNPKSGI